MSRTDWVVSQCRLLAATAEEIARTRPFAGLRIGTAIHVEPKTVAMLLTLQRGGAELVATGNLNSTQPESCEVLRAHGIEVVGGPTTDPAEQEANVAAVVAAEPDLLLDNGGDLFRRWLAAPYDHLRGGTEETTSGRAALVPLRDRIGRPVLVINDSPIKQFAENRHAVGQSVLESFLRITNRSTNGLRACVVGYGACGNGIALNLRAAHARVAVLEVDPVRRLEALLDGHAVPDREEALREADVVVTATGAADVVTAADLPLLRDGVVLVNAGHLPWEIDVPGLRSVAARVDETAEGITSLQLADGRVVHVLTGGHMVNLAGPRPLGNSIESMDLGFTLQVRCLEAVARGDVGPESCVVPVPRAIDERVATDYVALSRR